MVSVVGEAMPVALGSELELPVTAAVEVALGGELALSINKGRRREPTRVSGLWQRCAQAE